MKRVFTLTTCLKVFALLALLGSGSISNKALAQTAAQCQIQGAGNSFGPWYYINYWATGGTYAYGGLHDVQIGTTSPAYTLVSPSTTYSGGLDLTGSVSFAVTAGTTVPITYGLLCETVVGMYIDYDHDGYFNGTATNPAPAPIAPAAATSFIGIDEFIAGSSFLDYIYSPSYLASYSGSFAIPNFIPSGAYRARIVFGELYSSGFNGYLGTWPGPGNACSNYLAGTLSSVGQYVGSIDVTLNITNPATCLPPQPPTALATTYNSITPTWNPPSTVNNGYQYILVASGGSPTSPWLASGFTLSSSTTINGLTPSTNYNFYVRAGCSPTDSSVWAGPLSFSTLPPLCTTTPGTPSITNSPLTAGVCATNTYTLNASNVNTTVSGVTYQWGSSATGTAGSFNSLGASATGLSYTTPPLAIGAAPIFYNVTPTCHGASTNFQGLPSAGFGVTVNSYSIPYTQDFSTTANGAEPSCYEINNDPASGGFQTKNTFTSADGTPFVSNVATFNNQSTAASKNSYFTVPPLLLTGGTTYTVQFNYARSNSNYKQRLQVYVNGPSTQTVSADPGTTFYPGSPSVTGGTKIFDSSYSFNNVGLAVKTFTAPTSGTYYFTWYDSTTEATSIANGTAQGVGNIAIFIAQPCVRPTAQPTALSFTSNVSSISGTFTPASPAPNKYLVIRTLGSTPLSNFAPADGAYYYVNQAVGNGTVVYAGKNANFQDLYLSGGAQYTYTIFSYNDLCSSGPLYDVTSPLSATYQTTGGNTYVWNQTVAGDYQVAANWTPARLVLDPSDVLIFNNGTADTVNNVPTQNVGQIQVINNTNVRIRATASGAATLTILATTTTTNVLIINANSSIISDGTGSALTLAFGAANATATINGTLEMQNNGPVNVVNFFNCIATVGATGTLAAGGSVGATTTPGITYSSAANLFINGTYNHKYTTVVGGNIPLATWGTGSTVLISGYTSAAQSAGPGNLNNQTFYNFTYNCPNQTNTVNFGTGIAANTAFNALGTFSVISTGTSYFALSTSSYYIYNVGNFVQTGGIFDLGTGTPTLYQQSFNVSGSFNQSGGTMRSSNTGTTNSAMLNFNGISGTQNVNFFNTAPTGEITYQVSNYNGINLTGSGTLTSGSAFAINNYGGVRISTASPNPINTSLVLTYTSTGTTLTFDSLLSRTATAAVWPAVNGPLNLTVYVGYGNAVTVPFSRTVGGLLTFTSGDLDFNSNTLTTGTSASSPGSITAINGQGFVRLTTGALNRWFPVSGLPTANSTGALNTSYSSAGIGYFPVSYGGNNRNVYMYFTAATALGTGGTISVSHNSSAGLIPVSVNDNGYGIQQRTASSWTFATGNSIALAGTNTVGVRITAANLFNPINPANLHILNISSAAPGTHVAGGGTTPVVYAERTGLTLGNLTAGSMYIGAATADIGGVYTAINSGSWTTGSTWDIGSAPGLTNLAIINPGVTVTVPSVGSCNAKVLTNNGILNVNGGTLTLDSALVNNDTVNVSSTGILKVNGNGLVANTAVGITNNGLFTQTTGGTTTLGPVGGGNKPFTSNGTLNVSGGTMTINGNLMINGYTTTSPISQPNSKFVQSGGSIVVDGNAAGNAAASVSSSFPIVSFRSPNLTLTGGTFTITDPHANSSPNTFEYNVTTTNAPFYNYSVPVSQSNIAAAHTFIFGDGVSTDAGGNTTYGFKINTLVSSGKFHFGNVTVNGPSAGNRFVGLGNGSTSAPVGFLGNIIINNGGELRSNTSSSVTSTGAMAIKNNLTVNAGGTFTDAYLYIADFSLTTTTSTTGVLPGSATQTISGTGLFRNTTAAYSASSSTYANLGYIYMCGGSNLTILDSLSFSNTIYPVNFSYPAAGGTLPSRIIIPNISNYRLTERPGGGFNAPSQTTGWVVGAYQKAAGTGGINHTYPVGDMQYYTPVFIRGGTVATAGNIYARATQGLEPNIASSTLNPLKTVKRYFTLGIPGGDPIAFTAGTIVAEFDWVAADLPVGANINIFYAGLDSISRGSITPLNIWSYPTSTARTSTSIQVTGLGNQFTGNYSIGENCPPSYISTQPVTNTVCAGHADTLKVVGTGLGLTYQWYRGVAPSGTLIAGATSTNYIVPSATQADSGAYYVIMGGICAAPLTSTGATINVNNAPAITTQPLSSIVCVGGADTLAVVATGTAPLTYQWYQNGVVLPTSTFRRHFIANAALGSAGGYSVAVTNSCGTVTSNVGTVTVSPLPAATITSVGSTTACAGSSVVLQAPAGNISYSWTNNGVPVGTNSSVYAATTTGGVMVTVTNAAGCTATSAIADTVHFISAPPATIATTTNPNFCLPGSVVLYADTASGYSYVWLKNNSSTGFTGSYYTALTSGSYQVTVTNSYNCSSTSAPITVSANPIPTPTISASGPTTFCQPGQVILTTPNGSSYPSGVWTDLNTGAPVAGSDLINGATVYGSGSYEVTVTDANGCSGTSNPIIITSNPQPTATATAQGPTSICPGTTVVLNGSSGTDPNVTYQWYNGATPVSTATAASTYTASNGGSYTVHVRENATTCTNVSSAINVVIATPTASITPTGAQTLCAGSTATLSANAGASYQWYLNGSTPLVSTQTLNATQAGTYTVAVTNTSGCTATSAGKVITVVPLPVAAITAAGATTFCAGGSVVVDGNGCVGCTYTWLPGGQTTQNITATTTGTYSLQVKDANNCVNTSNSINVTSVPYPVPTLTSASLPTSICYGTTVLLTAGPIGNNYVWLFNGSPLPFTDPNRTSMSYPAGQTGTYSVTVTNSTGCASTIPTANGISVFVNPIPHVKTLGPSEFCWGSSDVLSVDGGTGSGLAYQWYDNGNPVAGATGQNFTIFDSGVYKALVTVVGSCSQMTPDSIKVVVDGLPLPSIVGSGNHVATVGTYNHYQWFNGTTPLVGDTLSSLIVSDPGNYHVVVTNGKGCEGVSNVYKYGTTGVASVSKDDINIYPNPVSSVVHIDAPMPVDATIVAVDGRSVLQSSDVKVMDLTGLANGVYMIRVYDKSGALVKVEKLVKASN